MKLRGLALYLVLGVTVAACSSPITPGGSTTVTISTGVAPANGAQIANAAQPVTLTVNNAVVADSSAGVIYTFEVSTDAGFAVKVLTRDVPETPGQTSLKLDALPPAKDYYWHVRTNSGGTVGSFSNGLKFTIGPAVVIGIPVVQSPSGGATSTSQRPTLTVTNVTRSGPVTALFYQFEVSSNSGFTTLIESGTVPEGVGTTSYTTATTLLATTQYFWRVRVLDVGSGIASSFSSGSTFTTGNVNAELWPNIVPPGTNGKAILGDNWQTQVVVSWTGVVFTSPTLEMRRIFDIIDKGFAPQAGIDWMHQNGYPTTAAYFSSIQVIGFEHMYMALINGRWDLIRRVGA
jgi:hypothetical protein